MLRGLLLVFIFYAIKINCQNNYFDNSIFSLSIRSEYQLISIRESYCQLKLFNPQGFQVFQDELNQFPSEEILLQLFSQKLNSDYLFPDSSQNKTLEMTRWEIPNNSIESIASKPCWTLVCYWSSRSAHEAQKERMLVWTRFQKQHPEYPLELYFIQQDITP
jgi:hypothetical protein